MATERKISGAVSVGSKTYVAGQEEDFSAAVKAGEKDDKTRVDVDELESRGVVVGFGKKSDPNAMTLNRQIDEKGKPADPKAEAKAEEILAESGAVVKAEPAPEPAAAAPKAAAKKPGRK